MTWKGWWDPVVHPQFHFWGLSVTKFQPVIAYDISKKNVVMQVQSTRIINCTVAGLQPHIDKLNWQHSLRPILTIV